MTKKRSTVSKQSPPPASVRATDVKPFGSTFIVKDTTLTQESELPDDVAYYPQPHLSKEAASAIVFANRAILFGEHTIGFLVQGKDNTYPFDALMFDLCIPEKPRLYLLAISTELTPMMLSLIALNSYLANKANRETLLAELTVRSGKDKRFAKAIGAYLTDERPLEVLLEKAVRKGLRGLCIFNTDDQKDAEIVTSYMGAHGGFIDVIFLRLYKVAKHTVLSMIPSFDDLKAEAPKPQKEKVMYTEEDHLANASELSKSIYLKLKAEALKLDTSLVVNPKGKHYISLRREGSKNLAFFHFRKSSIYLVVMLAEKDVRKLVKTAEVKRLPMSVQSFWNGPSTGLVITSTDHVKEIMEVLKKLVKG
jgi:hypothetical protein